MKKYGKYERMPDGTRAKQPKVKNVLLQTYFTSLLCLVLCVTMFFGTSYAWFTSEVTNTGNEIYIGILDVGVYKQNGVDDGGNTKWDDLASSETNDVTLFDNNVRWEPGYTALETVKIVDKGDLAFNYELTLTDGKLYDSTNADMTNSMEAVAKWFDVWVFDQQQETLYSAPEAYADITEDNGWTKVGTLADVFAGTAVISGGMDTDAVNADEDAEHTYTIALHMNGEKATADQQDALNTLMGQKIELSVKLVATQYTSENDAFNANYDLGAFANRLAQVNEWEEKTITCTQGIGGTAQMITLDTAYQFLPNESLAEAEKAPYRYYHADYVVKADKDVPANSMALAGYYNAWCQYNNDNWVALTSDAGISAETEIRLVQALGVTVNYEEICQYGSDGTGFLCGAVDLTGENAGTTITVQLRLYETTADPTTDAGSKNEETGRYIVVCEYTYTFPEKTNSTAVNSAE